MERNKLRRFVKSNDLDGICKWVDAVVAATQTVARREAFIEAVDECEMYSKGAQTSEAKAVSLNIAVRITQRAKKVC